MILGGGIIGLEMGTVYSTLGARPGGGSGLNTVRLDANQSQFKLRNMRSYEWRVLKRYWAQAPG